LAIAKRASCSGEALDANLPRPKEKHHHRFAYARAESLFTYARRKTSGENSANLWDHVLAALTLTWVYEPAILEQPQKQRERGLP
jgi:hypothetical protein